MGILQITGEDKAKDLYRRKRRKTKAKDYAKRSYNPGYEVRAMVLFLTIITEFRM